MPTYVAVASDDHASSAQSSSKLPPTWMFTDSLGQAGRALSFLIPTMSIVPVDPMLPAFCEIVVQSLNDADVDSEAEPETKTHPSRQPIPRDMAHSLLGLLGLWPHLAETGIATIVEAHTHEASNTVPLRLQAIV